jgi:hypothetical protein
MFRKFVVVAAIAMLPLSADATMSDSQFQQCMSITDRLDDFRDSQQRSADRVKDLQLDLRALDTRLTGLDLEYNIAESSYRGCLSSGWGNCDQQARMFDNVAARYNQVVDAYNRIGDREVDAVRAHQRENKRWSLLEDRYNQECVGTDVPATIYEKHCTNNSNTYCNAFR